jgi:hypothetical protein
MGSPISSVIFRSSNAETRSGGEVDDVIVGGLVADEPDTLVATTLQGSSPIWRAQAVSPRHPQFA